MAMESPVSPPAAEQVEAQEVTMDNYQFPTGKLMRRMTRPGRTPLVLVACGSFSPPTLLHLRLFSLARDHARVETNFEVVGGYMSPVSDAYKKVGLAPSKHRIKMCQLAIASSTWTDVDPWEAIQPDYVLTAKVLDHFDYEINQVLGGVEDVDGNKVKVQISLLAGADLIETMSQPGLWSHEDLERILGHYGAFIIERKGTFLDEALDNLKELKDNIHLVEQVVTNEISSTKVRLLVKHQLSIDYLTPDSVINYIVEHGLYRQDPNDPNPTTSMTTTGTTSISDAGKGKQKEMAQ